MERGSEEGRRGGREERREGEGGREVGRTEGASTEGEGVYTSNNPQNSCSISTLDSNGHSLYIVKTDATDDRRYN